MTDYHDQTLTLLVGDARERLRDLPDASVQTVVTSPPYFGLRDYGVEGQIGLEKSLDAYVDSLVNVFREVRRVLRDDGTVWLNLGDSYANVGGSPRRQLPHGDGRPAERDGYAKLRVAVPTTGVAKPIPEGIKPKDLMGVPWRVAFALQADGWYLRADIVWAKPNPMPESVRDRPTRSHEFVFLLTKSPRYYYDAEAVKEPASHGREAKWDNGKNGHGGGVSHAGQGSSTRKFGDDAAKRNRRDVWHIATRPFSGAHFAVFPPDLIEPCILAGTSKRGECPECGTPWVRQTAVIGTERQKWGTSDAAAEARLAAISGGLRQPGLRDGTVQVRETVGWAAGCTHQSAPVPQLVLDPFGGAGTTALVANKFGRRAVLIELNPDYAALTLRRLGRETTPLAAAA